VLRLTREAQAQEGGQLAGLVETFRQSVGQWFPHVVYRTGAYGPDLEAVALSPDPGRFPDLTRCCAGRCWPFLAEAVDGR
jgi:hypothetical protein